MSDPNISDWSKTTDALVVLTTVAERADAERLARLLVEKRLAACVQILPPLTSVYRWQGAIEQAEEHLILIKTTRAAYETMAAALMANHPYETPELIALPVVAGAETYLAWLRANL